MNDNGLSKLKDMYCAYVQSEEYLHGEESEELTRAREKALDTSGGDISDELGTYLFEQGAEFFAIGFRMATQIMAECIPARKEVRV